MAFIRVDRKPLSWLALLLMLATFVAMAYAVIAGVKLGGMIYLAAVATIVLGMASREDAVAVGGVMGLSLLVILDIYKDIGVLTHY
ncbi:MAG: hypothetical protein ACYDCK_01980 [Thermoplasmatota archaeon]